MTMMRFTSTSRWLWMLFVAFGLGAAIAYSVLLKRKTPFMTLDETLWVTDRDYSRYYPPRTAEAQAAADALLARDSTLGRRQFESPVLYRSGLTDTESASEPVLVIGFDPATIPAGKIQNKR